MPDLIRYRNDGKSNLDYAAMNYNRQYGTRYRSVIPTNLYGPSDNYHLENSHVLPAMIRKYHLAKLAAKGDIEAIINDERIYGTIPDDIQNAIGYDAMQKSLDGKVTPKVILWGTGAPRREFFHVDDMAAACLHAMARDQHHFQGENPSFLNVGMGEDVTIGEAAGLIAEIVGFEGDTVYDEEKPDGMLRKLLSKSVWIVSRFLMLNHPLYNDG